MKTDQQRMNNKPEGRYIPPPGRLLQCPNADCYKINKRGEHAKQMLGRVLEDGNLMIMRFKDGTTVVNAESYQLVCGCGHGYTVMGTVVEQNIVPKVV